MPIHEQKLRFILFAILLICIFFAISTINTYMLYKTSLQETKYALMNTVQVQATLTSQLVGRYPDGRTYRLFSLKKTLGHIANAQKKYQYNRTQELTVGTLENKNFRFLIINGTLQNYEDALVLPLGSPEAIPMQRALLGETGTIEGKDYKGNHVIAAYTPVAIDNKTVGFVAKINLFEIQKTFLITLAKTTFLGFWLICFGIFAFYHFTKVFFKKLEQREKEYRDLVNNSNAIIVKMDAKGKTLFFNSYASDFFIYKPELLEEQNLYDSLKAAKKNIETHSTSNDEHDEKCLFDDCLVEETGEKNEVLFPHPTDSSKDKWVWWNFAKVENSKGELTEVLCIGHDTTTKHEAQKQLEDSRKQYFNIFQNAPLGLVHFTKEGVIADCNDSFVEIIGSSREQLIGFEAATQSGPHMKEAVQDSIMGKQSKFEDFYTSVTGGKTAYLRVFFNPFKVPEGYEVIATVEDRTDQFQIENRFKAIAIGSPTGIIITTHNGNVLYANGKMLELCDMPYDQLQMNGWLPLLTINDQQLVVDNWLNPPEILQRKLELQLIVDDQVKWCLAEIVSLKKTQAPQAELVITFTDITTTKETALQQKRLTTAIDQATESIVITDLNGLITYANPAFEKLSGYSPKEFLGQNPRILKSGEHDPQFYEDMWKTILTGNTWTGKIVNRAKDGKLYTQEATIRPVRNAENELVSYVCVGRDISQQLVMENQLRQAQRLESIGELAAGIAHEINTPAQYVLTNIRFLEEGFETLSDSLEMYQKAQPDLEDIDKEELEYLAEEIPTAIRESDEGLEKIARIVKSVKQLSHPAESQKALCNMNSIIRDAANISANEWKYSSDIVFDLNENIPDIFALQGALGQVFLNIIVNSAHAIEARQMEDKGRISISSTSDDAFVTVKISDNGGGIPPHIIDKIFEPFFTTKEVGKGTGQGLAISQNIVVNVHNGQLFVDSTEGEGTTFTIQIPITTESEESEEF
ncbi:MAG: PAS domain S-box protein [Desulfovibrio sp.]